MEREESQACHTTAPRGQTVEESPKKPPVKKAPAATDSAHSRVEPSGSLLRGRCGSPSNNTPIALDGGGEFPHP